MPPGSAWTKCAGVPRVDLRRGLFLAPLLFSGGWQGDWKTILFGLYQEWPVDGLTGRRKIYTSKKKVATGKLVVEVLGKALAVHRINRAETAYLYDYYRGKQDIRLKDKIVRPEINQGDD